MQDQPPKSTVPRSFAFFLAKGRESTTLNLPDDQERTGVHGDAGPRGRVFVRGVMGQVFVAAVGKGPRTSFSSGVPKERSLLFGVEFGGGESKNLHLFLCPFGQGLQGQAMSVDRSGNCPAAISVNTGAIKD